MAFSDDGRPVANARVMRRALEYAKAFDLALIDHCEEPTLAEKACMNEGPVSTHLGLRGQPAAGEAIMVERDVLLAELTVGRGPTSPTSRPRPRSTRCGGARPGG